MAEDRQEAGSVSPELDAMVCDVIGAFLDALAEGADPGVVVCLEDAAAHRYEAAFGEDGEEACLEGAISFVSGHAAGLPEEGLGAVERYAIAYAGCVELASGAQDALIVSFYERGEACGYSAFVAFSGFGTGDGFMWSDPEPAGEEPPLI